MTTWSVNGVEMTAEEFLAMQEKRRAEALAAKGPDDKCPKCGAGYVWRADGWSETLVGYGDGDCGKPHDDNCLNREFRCASGHSITLSERRRCDCGWVGKDWCGTCGRAKVEKWPDPDSPAGL